MFLDGVDGRKNLGWFCRVGNSLHGEVGRVARKSRAFGEGENIKEKSAEDRIQVTK